MDLYGHIATTIHDLPVGVINGKLTVIAEGEQVTIGNAAGPDAWWIQTTDGRKTVAYTEELQEV